MPAYAAFRHANYRRFAAGYTAILAQQMVAVGIGWELYARTRAATALGAAGLVEALPVLVLSLPAGHVADRFDRRRVAAFTMLVVTLLLAVLALVAHLHDAIPAVGAVAWINDALAASARGLGETRAAFTDPVVPWYFLLLLLIACCGTFYSPAKAALLPGIVPAEDFPNAVTWNSSLFQVTSVVGPMLGGLLIAGTGSYALVYACAAVACALAVIATLLIRYEAPDRTGGMVTVRTLAAGFRFVWRTKMILATITLDLFAVFLGGATALLPMFARDILHVGADGLGWLRAAPALGAAAMGITLAHLPPMRRAGRSLLWAVAGFGVATIGFGLSRSFLLSLLLLFLTGAFDNVSVVIRHTLVQVLTPDAMRGRVSAVNFVFIGTSNELGAAESGLTAAIFGPVVSVVAGGLGALVAVVATALTWPALRRFGRLDGGGIRS